MKAVRSLRKTSKSHVIRASQFVSVVSLACFQNGCATPELWREAGFQPADPPSVRLFQANQRADILVQYDEQQFGCGTRTRTYFLFANTDRIEAYHPPKFVSASLTKGSQPIPIFEAKGSLTVPLPPTGCFAETSNRFAYVVYRDGECIADFKLPVYTGRANGLTARVLLTPPAMVVDAALLTALAWLQAGCPGIGGNPSPPTVAIKSR